MITEITNNLLWTQGWMIAGVLLFTAFIGLRWFRPLLYLSLILFAFSFYFFRNPDRICPQALLDLQLIVSPADGTIVDLSNVTDLQLSGYSQKISIFLSPFDVHVNWIPMNGSIEHIEYVGGSFLPAFLPKSSAQNEHMDLVLRDQDKRIMVRQIAGFIARRICWWVTVQQAMKVGEKYGMIRFGSRVDVFLPKNVELLVGLGQRVYGGQTVIARWL